MLLLNILENELYINYFLNLEKFATVWITNNIIDVIGRFRKVMITYDTIREIHMEWTHTPP